MTSTFRTVLLCTLFGLSTAAFADDAAKPEKPAKDAKSKKDAKAKPINKICPVEGGEIDPEVTVTHKGKVVAFCCAGCDEAFQKDPAKYLAIIAKDPKNKEAAKGNGAKKGGAKKDEAKKDDAKHEEHEHEHDGDTEKGEAEAKAAKLNAKCPVSGDDADPKMTADYKGKTVAFCCEDCAKDFEKNPKKYLANLEAQEKAAAAKESHDHDGDGKEDDDATDHEEHEHEDDANAEKKAAK